MASSTLVSYSTNRTMSGSTSSPSLIVFQSRPWNFGSPGLVGGLFSRSCIACCVSDGCREVRGDVGAPRICSAKLPRWERGSALEPILSAGGGDRAIDAVELLKDCSGEGEGVVCPSFFVFALSLSAMMEGTLDAVRGAAEGHLVAACLLLLSKPVDYVVVRV